MIPVPASWNVLPLGQVLETQGNKRKLQQGWSPRCLTHPAGDRNTWGVVKTTAIQPGWFDDSKNKELPPELDPRPAIEIHAGDLLMTCAGPRSRCGVPALVRSTRPRLMMSGKMYRFRPVAGVDPRFLEKWLLAPDAQTRVDAMKTGISESGLNLTQDRFLELPVPIPPTPEQRRIVEILDDHLSRLDAAGIGLRRVQERAASIVPASAAHHVAFAADAALATVGERSVLVEYGSGSKSSPDAGANGVPVLRMGNIKEGSIDWSSLKFLPETHSDFPRLLLRQGDLLFNRTNSAEHVGKSAVFHGDGDVSFASYLIRVRFDETVLPGWANLVINSPRGRGYVASVVSQQVGQANVNGTKLKAFPLLVPSLEEQRVRMLEHQSAVDASIRLRAEARLAEERSAGLRRALLTAAFSGKLTGRHTDAEVIEELASV